MAEDIVLREVRLGPDHAPTGQTRHFVGGELMAAPASLRIVRYADAEGFYLLYLDDHGDEMTDTLHESLEAALAQAAWEFHVQPEEWAVVGER